MPATRAVTSDAAVEDLGPERSGHADPSAPTIFLLAEQYRAAALALFGSSRPRVALSHAPWRLMAAHSVELYLNAFLLAAGLDQKSIRKLQHDLVARAELAGEKGLVLRRRTVGHLKQMMETREYLSVRYYPQALANFLPPSRTFATLTEVANKTAKLIAATAGSVEHLSSPEARRQGRTM
ncbi:hypothetical protein [Consotaella salsifontis]|uniref:hypothetical protein n=1 Tax=Consotaella salsifontis TaxID=1365950 RepID=UPI0010552273|nr:hypothetical protein [Consotaella salsifontis]